MVYSRTSGGRLIKLNLTATPRIFIVNDIKIKDYGKIALDPDEMVSFITGSGREFDFIAKDWGFYATSSINGRLQNQGFKTALCKNLQGRIYVLAVEQEKLELFKDYCNKQRLTLIEWLDEYPVKE